MIYKIADLICDIVPKTTYVERLFRPYLVDEKNENLVIDLACSFTKEEIIEESIKEKIDVASCESIMIHRFFCKIIVEKFNGMAFHSSAISVNNKGILFSAPSGTGKSTHAALWRKLYSDVVTINDDKPFIRFVDDIPYVYGSPWMGKHMLGGNVKSKIDSFIFLKQDKINSIEKLDRNKAFANLYGQTQRFSEKNLTDNLLDMINNLVKYSKFYLLKCNISDEAAQLVRKTVLDN